MVKPAPFLTRRESMATRKRGRKGAAKRGAKKGGRKKAGARKAGGRRAAKRGGAKRAKRAPNPAFMKPMQPSDDLGAVVGARPMPRTEVTKRIWDYIRRNGLQDQKNRRMINADDRLRAVFGGRRQVSMFEMTKLVNNHLKNT
jgi:upstream activation factor subunit UAF30